MFKYFLILLVVLGFVDGNNNTFCQSTTDANKSYFTTEAKIDTLQAKITELQTQVRIVEEAREGYSDNITGIGIISAIVVTLITVFVGLILPWYNTRRFNKKINKIVIKQEERFDEKIKEHEKGYKEKIVEQEKNFDEKIHELENKFDEKIAELEYKNTDIAIDVYYIQYAFNSSDDIFLQIFFFMLTWKYYLIKKSLKDNHPNLPAFEEPRHLFEYSKLITKLDKQTVSIHEYNAYNDTNQFIEDHLYNNEKSQFQEFRRIFNSKITVS